MRERTSQLLYAYWNEVRGERIAPRRFEIEPSRIARLLPETFILERRERKDYLFRLAGTQVCELFGRELRGLNLVALWSPEDQEALVRILESVCREGAVGVVGIEAHEPLGERKTQLEMLFLPLIHSELDISRLLGSLTARDSPAWLGAAGPASLAIRSFHLVWPDGRPHAVLARTARQAPFVKQPPGTRVVTSSRRAFRVYQGGLSKDDTTES